MGPALKIFLISVLIGLSFGTFIYLNYDHRPVRILISIISSVSIGSLMMLAIYYRSHFTVVTGNVTLKMVIMIFLLLLAAMAGTEITLIIQAWLTNSHYTFLNGGSIYVLNILVVMVAGIPIYVSEEWKSVANARVLNQQYRLLQLEQQKTMFELEALRSKINPHFLYNVHNTIAGLISKDPAKAEKLVLLLSKFFRFTLTKSSPTFHAVSEEIDIITTYLQMLNLRYESRMTYAVIAGPEVLHLQMPSFILQPLVENAVKHGIENTTGNGFVNVEFRLKDDTLLICISDSGPAFADIPITGHGLGMVSNKLKLLYNDDYELELVNRPTKHVRISIPKNYQHPLN
ncbi:sensor histidine kinase [Flavitalea antarctica]